MDLSPTDSVIPRFHALVEATPDRPFLTFVGDDGREEARLTPRGLSERATRVAGALHAAGLSRGDRVVLAYPPGLEFVVGLLGSMMAGLIPVPVAPPHPMEPGAELARFAAMVASCGAGVALTDQRWLRARRLGQARDAVVGLVRATFSGGRASWPELTWHATESLRGGPAPVFEQCADDVALLQYTSGSTAAPRGVMITHGNLAHQLACNAAELGLDPDSHAVCWLPHFHDFGLISGILSALRGNGRLTLLSPLTFIRRPAIWMELLSARRATHTAAPNFAYELVVRKTTPAQRASWDLRALRVAMSAAEPVREGVVQAFCEAFAVSGFRPDAFAPAYGLAEHTVGVSVAGKARVRVDRRALEVDGVARPSADPAARALVGCGRPSAGVEVRVVDPETTRALGEGRVGELWVDSPSKAAGYWGLPEASRETFEAELSPPAVPADAGRRWLRTGDLGFLYDGELFVTGRLKDLIIVRGRNVYPQDVEDSVRLAHAAIRPGGIAAFSTDDGGTERVVVLVEAREKKTSRASALEMAKAVRRAMAEEHQLACDVVAVMEPGGVLKTTSGKVRRRACRQAWEGGTLAGIEHRIGPSAEDPVVVEPVEAVEEDDAPDLSARTEGLAPGFAALIARASRYLVGASQGGEKRPGGVAALGMLLVDPAPELPRHRFFAAGRELPVLLRHDNRTVSDDAAPDARVASLRVLRTPGDLDSTRLDLAMLTGRCFFHRTAEDFFRFSVAPPAAREAILRAEPHRSAAAWEGIREATAYDRYHYHSQTVTWFIAADGARYYARYRLRSPERPEDEGFAAPDGLFPATAAPRRADDTRSGTCLSDAFVARLAAGPVGYVLEVQVVPVSSDAAAKEALLDCTRPWDAPWRHLASIHLDRPADAVAAAALEVNPAHAPRDLGVVYARDERSSASIDHVRTIVYEVSARTRLGRPLSPDLAALLSAAPVAPSPAAAPVAPSSAAAPVAPSPA
ncbi:MAG: AMP-binding protein, partial [Pseudomonadota bacterium]|nr:AMP-binding protein [Pseudomonadota bacterium]